MTAPSEALIKARVHPTTDGSGYWLSIPATDRWPEGKRVGVSWRGMHDDSSIEAVARILRDWGYILMGSPADAGSGETAFLIARA